MILKSIRNIKRRLTFLFIKLSPFNLFLFFFISNFKSLKTEKIKVIYIKSPKFDEEIKLLTKFESKNIIFLPISARLLKTIYSKYFSKNFKYINDYNYDIEVRNNLSKKLKLFKYWNNFFRILLKFYNIKCVINPNFIYTYLQEFNRAAQLNLVKNVTIYKEGINPAYQNDFLIQNYYANKKYLGDFIFFKNKSIRNSFEKVVKISRSKTYISGLLNIDDFFNLNTENQNQLFRATLFYSYPEEKKKGLGSKIYDELDIKNQTEIFYVNFIKVTNLLSDLKFIIKIKKNDHYPPLHELLKKYKLKLNKNVTVICNEKTVLECIKNSSIICSFNSSSLIEALVLKKPIIEPKLEWNKSNIKHNFLVNFEHLSFKAGSYENLLNYLKENKKIKYLDKDISLITEHFFGYIDGNNRKRLINKLVQILNL